LKKNKSKNDIMTTRTTLTAILLLILFSCAPPSDPDAANEAERIAEAEALLATLPQNSGRPQKISLKEAAAAAEEYFKKDQEAAKLKSFAESIKWGNDCRKKAEEIFTGLFKNPNSTIYSAEVRSSWMTNLYYVAAFSDNGQHSIEFLAFNDAKGKLYLHLGDFRQWQYWRDAPDHGKHYDDVIRDDESLSVYRLCEALEQ
jgi:hypothetical protein